MAFSHADERARAIIERARDDDQLRARCRAIVERTIRDQGLNLQVRDPLALHQVASLVLTTDGRS